jgi:hypothetical protein
MSLSAANATIWQGSASTIPPGWMLFEMAALQATGLAVSVLT